MRRAIPVDDLELALAPRRLTPQGLCDLLVRMGEMEVMDAPNFTALTAEDLLTLIEDAGKILDQKIAAEKADIEERQIKLTKLLARRAGKDVKAAKKPAAPKPRGRPAQVAAPKPVEQAAQPAA